jgi:hypothetical protein
VDCRPTDFSTSSHFPAFSSPEYRLLIALHSLDASLKPDCSFRLQRKEAKVGGCRLFRPVSPVQFPGKSRTIAAISKDYHRDSADFLCNPDCMAEREGFEPSVQVLARTTV